MIKGYVGTYGSGKTLQLVRDAQFYFKRDFRVISNVPLWGFDSKGKKKMADFLYTEEIQEFLSGKLFQEKPTLLVVDEASALFDSYKFKQIPDEIFDVLKQSRKLKLDIFYTSQRHKDIATRIRDNSEIIYICENHFRHTPFHVYSALGVQPFYFNDNAKSVELKQYILKRKIDFGFNLSRYYKFYSTDFIVTGINAYKKFSEYLGNPRLITPDDIITLAKSHIEIRPPL